MVSEHRCSNMPENETCIRNRVFYILILIFKSFATQNTELPQHTLRMLHLLGSANRSRQTGDSVSFHYRSQLRCETLQTLLRQWEEKTPTKSRRRRGVYCVLFQDKKKWDTIWGKLRLLPLFSVTWIHRTMSRVLEQKNKYIFMSRHKTWFCMVNISNIFSLV